MRSSRWCCTEAFTVRLLLEGHCYELSRAVGARLVAEGAAIGGGYAGGGEWLRLKNYP